MYHVAFPVSEKVSQQTFQIIDLIQEAERPRDHIDKLTDVIITMTDEGLRYLFVDSLKQAKVSGFQVKAVQLGIQTARKGLEIVGRRALKAMTDDNLRGIARFMEQVMIYVEDEKP